MWYKIFFLSFFCLSNLSLWAQVNLDSAFRHAESQTNVLLKEINQAYDSTKPEFLVPRSVYPTGELRLFNVKDWTSGFFPGNLWFLYQYTKDQKWLLEAQKYTALVEKEKLDISSHDVGFKIYNSFGAGQRLTLDTAYRSVIIQAAKSLATRFNPKVGCIQSWKSSGKWPFPVIIDNMMNLDLLFAATRLTGDSTFYNIAVSHASTTLINHFRPDYSSWHVIDYDTATGQVRRKNTHQGYSDSSAWARGQAWGLYGYTMCYRETKIEKYLKHAENIASFILEHPRLPKDLVPYWDFDDPLIPNAPRDASAAAVMASALYELSTYSKNSAVYRATADKIVNNLANAYASPLGQNRGFVLLHSTGHKPNNSEIDVPLIYADYYYLEALTRKKETNIAPKINSITTKSAVEGRKLRFKVSATDTNPNQIKYYYLVNAPVGAYMDPATGIFNWTPSKPGTYTFSARVSDSGSPVLYDQKQITIKVTKLQYYTLQVGITGSGRVTREPLQDKYADGTKVTLTAIPSNGYVFTGWSGDAKGTNTSISLILNRNKKVTANFAVKPEEEEIKLEVLNAETNEVITSLTEGLVLNLAALTTNKLNIQANTNPDKIKSVKFELSGKQNHTITESKAPYLLFGDVNGNANDWVPATGKYTIKATPFSEAGGKGNSGKPITFHFSVINKPLMESEKSLSLPEQFTHTEVPLVAYPTPTFDGQITFALPTELKGKFNYSLMSAVGSKLVSGENNANNSKVAKFDFSRQMSTSGIYYLHLENAGFKGWIKLVRQ